MRVDAVWTIDPSRISGFESHETAYIRRLLSCSPAGTEAATLEKRPISAAC